VDDRRILNAEETAAEREQHVNLIAHEFREGFEAVDRIDRPAVTIFGSARVREGSAPYDGARAVARGWREGFDGYVRAHAELAAELVLGVETVKSHVRALFDAFGLEDVPAPAKRAELVRRAFERGAVRG
jgi:hypothetical protein